MPHECPPVFRSGRAVDETDLAKRTSARRPSANASVRYRVALRKRSDNTPLAQTLPDCFGITTTVAQYPVRTTGWSFRWKEELAWSLQKSSWVQRLPDFLISR